jgi:uncharacterized protein with ParB-like and HNH nuclease domain
MGVKTSSIGHLLNEIRGDSIVLPDLQRDFVWKPSQTRQLFDSLMQDYPIGSLLLWETNAGTKQLGWFHRTIKNHLTKRE